MRASFLSLLLCIVTAGSLLASDTTPTNATRHLCEKVAALVSGARDDEHVALDRSEEAKDVPRKRVRDLQCKYLITAADDFIVEAYKNGKLLPDENRELLLDRFGDTVEKIYVMVRNGDWLVFQVVCNRLRWGGSK